MYVCMYERMYVCMYVCMYACMYACVHVCMYVCMYLCIYVCLIASVRRCARVVHLIPAIFVCYMSPRTYTLLTWVSHTTGRRLSVVRNVRRHPSCSNILDAKKAPSARVHPTLQSGATVDTEHSTVCKKRTNKPYMQPAQCWTAFSFSTAQPHATTRMNATVLPVHTFCNLCMDGCMYVYKYARVNVCEGMNAYPHVRMYECMYACMYVRTYVCM